MKITFLDSSTLGSDLSFREIEKFGSVVKYETTFPSELVKRITDSEIVITNKVVLGENEMKSAKNLKLICVAATGINNIDTEAAKKYNIAVANVKGYSTESVAQTVLAYMLQLSSSTSKFNEYTASGEWQMSNVFTSLKYPFFELNGKVLGIIGYGAIGKRVAEIAKVFGMRIIIAESMVANIKKIDRIHIDELLKKSDFVSIHTPLTSHTKNLITSEELKKMKPTAFLLNTARGGIVNESDLRKGLETNVIAGAGFDVLSHEPPSNGNPLINAPNIILTPHIAWTSKESRERLMQGITDNIRTYSYGNVEHIDLC